MKSNIKNSKHDRDKHSVQTAGAAKLKRNSYLNIPIEQLYYDIYQRGWDEAQSKKIVADFDANALGTIVVSERDGKYYVIDGQHRIRALTLMSYKTILCEVRTGLTKLDEAELFFKINFIKKMQSSKDKINSLLESGCSLCTTFVSITNEEGYTFALRSNKDNGTNQKLIKVVALESLYASYISLKSSMLYRKMLRLTRKTWGDNKGSVQAQMIRGMTVFIKLYGNDINERVEKRFIEKLRNYDPARIVATGRFHNDSDGTSVAIARIILKYYNAGRSTNALSNKFDKI